MTPAPGHRLGLTQIQFCRGGWFQVEYGAELSRVVQPGKTTGFGPVNEGSNPSPGATPSEVPFLADRHPTVVEQPGTSAPAVTAEAQPSIFR